MAKYGMLIDETRCTGCRACQVACKQWNDLPAEKTRNTGTYQNPPALSASTWNLIEFKEIDLGSSVSWYFVKRACMHCEYPACASVCPVGALHKTETGAVVYDDHKCIGCRYCMAACPFGVPSFDWQKGLLDQPLIRKCSMCIDRTSNGLIPACAKTCPAGAITFGERDKLIVEAEQRIANNYGRYVNQVYGKTEAGGTSILYLAAVSFDKLGLPTLGPDKVTKRSEAVMNATIPFAVAWGATLAGAYGLVRFNERKKLGKAMAEAKKKAAQDSTEATK
jgi:formate dehydrogenase iron-sulfur subunit